MWSILYNGHTITLPNSDDFYTVITDTTKMFTTNVDLPITEDLINIFNIRGLLTREDGVYFKKVSLPCTLQGFGVRIPCKISIESIKQKEGLLNLYLEAKSIFGYNIAEQVNQRGFEAIWDNCHYPLYQDPNEQSWTPIYTGYSKNDILYANCHVPRVNMNTFIDIANQLGWRNTSTPDIAFFPNNIYINSKYKMRRQFVRMKSAINNFNDTITYPCEGYYAGFINSELKASQMHHLVKGQHFVIDSTFSTMPFRNIRHYFRYNFIEDGTHTPFTVTLNITYTQPFVFSYQGSDIPASYNNTTQLFEINHDISDLQGAIEDQFFDLQSDNAGSFHINYTAERGGGNDFHGDVDFRLYVQCMIDDEVNNIIPIPNGDISFEKEEITEPFEGGEITYRWHKMTTKGWNSLSWAGDMTEGYDGLLITNFQSNSPYNEDFYNSSPALMWTNALDWFYDYSLRDIFKIYQDVSGKEFNLSVFALSFGWGENWITDIDQYVLYDELILDDSEASLLVKFANGTESLFGADPNNSKTIEVPQNQVIGLDAKHFSTITPSGVDTQVYAPLGEKSDDNKIIADNTLLNKTAKITDTTHVSTVRGGDGGIFVYSNSYGGYTIDYKILTPTTLEVGQIVNTHVAGYIPTPFVVYQTRTFRVLEQEIDASGVNNLKLLLYK